MRSISRYVYVLMVSLDKDADSIQYERLTSTELTLLTEVNGEL